MGPGDPELLTIKAARRLESATVVAFFARHDRPGHARTIARPYLAPQVRDLRFTYPYTTELNPGDPLYMQAMAQAYDTAARMIAAEIQAGQNVALLCEGDPFFYGSAMYVYDRLRAHHPIEIIPGLPGMIGGWAQAGCPIVHGDDVLTVLPGTLPEDELITRLRTTDAAVIMKIGRNLPKLRSALTKAGLDQRAVYVERATMEQARILPLDQAPAPAPYFSLILVPGRQNPR